jgi:choline dehydrogenase-like flavoprotein
MCTGERVGIPDWANDGDLHGRAESPQRFLHCDHARVAVAPRRATRVDRSQERIADKEELMASKNVADILVIGSGASGGPFAWHLSKIPNLSVVCLEQGDWVRPQQTQEEIRAKAMDGHPESQSYRRALAAPPQAGVRYVANGYPYDYSESYWQPILSHAVGGATIHYSAVWARLHPSDFLAHSLDGVADDWPIRYADLAPFYDLVDRTVGVAGVPGNPAYPPKSIEMQPPHALTKAGEVLSGGFKKLGWHWWPAERTILSAPFRGRSACNNDCASCPTGCPREAKNSSDVVFWPEAIRNGVVLKTKSRVREITVNKQGLADGVLYYDADGRLKEQKARVVAVACNGIGTPRLLLNSKSSHFPHGLANSSGMVGKNLMGHPSANVTGLFEAETNDPRGRGDNPLNSDQFYESDPGRGFARGLWLLSGAYVTPTAAALGEPPLPAATVVPAALRIGPGQVGDVRWGAAHHIAFEERYRHTIGLAVFADELPSEVNRVELHPTLTDDTGIPAPKLIFKRSDNTEKALAFGIERSKQIMEAAGATKIISATISSAAPGHYLGTARMGDDPNRSVVDKWCRAHDVRNLFIIDGSVFTTAGSTVPTCTIQAIALRTADYFKNNLRHVLA